jgi:hypothetical protein
MTSRPPNFNLDLKEGQVDARHPRDLGEDLSGEVVASGVILLVFDASKTRPLSFS